MLLMNILKVDSFPTQEPTAPDQYGLSVNLRLHAEPDAILPLFASDNRDFALFGVANHCLCRRVSQMLIGGGGEREHLLLCCRRVQA